jgi:hypothetical protein
VPFLPFSVILTCPSPPSTPFICCRTSLTLVAAPSAVKVENPPPTVDPSLPHHVKWVRHALWKLMEPFPLRLGRRLAGADCATVVAHRSPQRGDRTWVPRCEASGGRLGRDWAGARVSLGRGAGNVDGPS